MRKLNKILLCLVLSVLFVGNVSAATGSVTATTGTKVAVVGSTFEVKVTVKSTAKLGTWKFGIAYDSSNISLVSGDTLVVGYNDGKINSSTVYTYRFKAIKSGSAGIRITSAEIADFDTVAYIPTTTSGTNVTIKTQAEIQASYSKDNNLKGLSVEGYEISPAFDKDTLEYMVSVPDTVTQINIKATKSDNKARVTGTGIVDISEGVNKFDIVVTAENGSAKTYTLNVDVKDLNPIEVEVDGEKYTVVKKSDLLVETVGFTLGSIVINDMEIPVYKNELTEMTLVGLKNISGKVNMFLYDANSRSYSKYNELRGSSIVLYPLDIESIPDGFVKDKLSINGIEYEVLKNETVDDFYLIYAQNIETGEKHYYQFDPDTNGLTRYNDAYQKVIERNEEFTLYLIALGGVAGVFFLLTIVLGSKISKLKKILRKLNQARREETTSNELREVEIKETEEESKVDEEYPQEELSDENLRLESDDSKSESPSQEENYVDFLENSKRKKKRRRK